MKMEDSAMEVIKRYATNGRDAVNIVQIAASLAMERGDMIKAEDIEWVVNCGQYTPRPERKIPKEPQIGVVNGLAVYGPNMGALLEIEVTATPATGQGQLTITGVVDEEETGGPGKKIRRKSMARSSVDNVMTLLRNQLNVEPGKYNIHINFPGGAPIDGPSAGVTMATAIYSAISRTPVNNRVAMTGEVSIRGLVKAVGGVTTKISAAKQAGAAIVIIPRENWQESFRHIKDVEVVAVDRIEEVIDHALVKPEQIRLEVVNSTPTAVYTTTGGVSV
jgi:ATP-dependent Lon protease